MVVAEPVRAHGFPAHVGVVWRPDFRPGALAGFAGAAEQAGVDELWLWEDCFLQGGIAQAAVALAETRSLVVGIGVLPAPLRESSQPHWKSQRWQRCSPAACSSRSVTAFSDGCVKRGLRHPRR